VIDPRDKPLEPKTLTKKSYITPRLEVYGNLAKVTNTVGNMGMADGGMGAMNRTRP
jgi:hypothetical protein